MRRREAQKSKTTGLGVSFIAVVVVLIALSISFKAIQIIRSSKFDGKTNFYILTKQSYGFEDIVLSSSNSSITLLQYKTKDKSLSDASLPYDLYSSSSDDIDQDNLKSEITSLLRNAGANPFDLFRAVLFINQNSQVTTQGIDSSNENDVKNISEDISDPQISSENLTIEVSNATGVSGVGSVIAKMISYMGGNVILVSTDEKVSNDSQIVTQDVDSLTAKKLSKMLNIKIDKSKPSLSDLKIVVGTNLLGKIGL